MGGGVTFTDETDIFEMILTAKDVVGETEVKLTEFRLSGYDENNNVVFLDASVKNDTVRVTVEEPEAAQPIINITGDPGVLTTEDARFAVSAKNIEKLATATIWIEVEDAYFTQKSFAGLNGFQLINGVKWTQDGGKLIGQATLANMGGGVTFTDETDIFELILTAMDAVGTTAVKLTRYTLSGYDENNNVVFLEAGVENDTVQVTVDQSYSIYDVNRDTKVDQLDITTAQFYYQAGADDENWNIAKKADVNTDNVVNIEDFILIMNHIAWEQAA
jgi:hypothetical protein